MKCATSARAAFSIVVALGFGATPAGSATPPRSAAANRDVIVILRDQMPNLPAERSARGARTAALAAAQAPLLAHLRSAGAGKIRSFGLINALAATVSRSEADLLAAHPLVQAVVPDRVIRLPPAVRSTLAARSSTAARSAAPSAAADTGAGLCNTLEPEALQLINAAFADAGAPQAQTVIDETGRPVTGAGVRVAIIADGLDPTLAGFVRPDGSSIFFDHQDFSGDPAGTPTAGGEAFGDASSIAAQDHPNGSPLTFDISQFVNPALPLPSPCDIRIRGVAPGASLAALKVISNINATTTSSFVEGIEWAVTHDDVDIINEPFGSNPYPDNANDPIALANDAAVRAGVTVLVATGDGGTAGTLESPSTDPAVIAVGASTAFRAYAQTGEGAARLAKGFIDGNISSLSSGGFAQTRARMVDVVVPGDLGWALCSPNQTLYTDCANDDFATDPDGAPSPLQVTGGTSQSVSLASGAAALVIQAYRSTHHGTSPAPALVKQLLMGTATDLGAPAYEQGAGLVNALAAVEAALSWRDENGTPKARGAGIVAGPASAGVTGTPDAAETLAFSIVNTGKTNETLVPVLQALGPPLAGATVTLQLATGDKTFVDETGLKNSYVKQTFNVPAGAEHLDAAIAFTGANSDVSFSLLDPSGRLAAYSLPQGLGSGYAHVDVVAPAAGKWTAIVWTVSGFPPYTDTGPVQFTWAAESFVSAGSVSPASFNLAPGTGRTITARFDLPSQPGDSAAAIRFATPGAGLPEIPISMRTLIPLSSSGAVFTGTLTGGNGRANVGPAATYEFVVPKGVNNLGLTVEIPDNGDLLQGMLVDPNGMELAVDGNLDPSGSPQYGLQLFRANPEAGSWRFILLQNFAASGNETSLPFTARIGLDTAQISAPGLPNDRKVQLSASAPPLTVAIQVVNTGAVTEAFFADARLTKPADTTLASQPCSPATTLPGLCAIFFVPPEVSELQFSAQSPAPIAMEAVNEAGFGVGVTLAPQIYAQKSGAHGVIGTISVPEVPWGPWVELPSLLGRFGAAGAQPTPVSTGAIALMLPFDPAISADSGDIWADLAFGTNTYNPLTLSSGDGGIIQVTITPDPSRVGQTVSGYLYVDTFNDTLFTGDEVVRIPYSYTVVR